MSEIDWSKAPEGATHWQPDTRQCEAGWLKIHGLSVWAWIPGRGWVGDAEMDDHVVPRPTEWRGPEDGLPPVGTVAMGKMPAWRKEEKCKVIAHLHGSCVVVYGLGDNPDRWSTLAWCDQFYPLKKQGASGRRNPWGDRTTDREVSVDDPAFLAFSVRDIGDVHPRWGGGPRCGGPRNLDLEHVRGISHGGSLSESVCRPSGATQ